MTTVGEVRDFLLEKAPLDQKEEWDNVGLLCGRANAAVHRILVSLDVTKDVLSEAKELGYDLVVSHHPMLFGEIREVNDGSVTGELLLTAAEAGIACVNCHTNLDKADGGVNDVLAQAIGLRVIGKAGEYLRFGNVEKTDAESFARKVKEKLNCPGLRWADGGRPVQIVAVGGGACADEMDGALDAGCDTLVTADVKYHQFLEAAARGLNLFDAGHFQTENPICQVLADWLRGAFSDLPCDVSRRHGDVIRFLT